MQLKRCFVWLIYDLPSAMRLFTFILYESEVNQENMEISEVGTTRKFLKVSAKT